MNTREWENLRLETLKACCHFREILHDTAQVTESLDVKHIGYLTNINQIMLKKERKLAAEYSSKGLM